MSNIDLLWYWQQNRGGLPAGYRRVEYLESSGAQWIDTGYMFKSDSVFELRCARAVAFDGMSTAYCGAKNSTNSTASNVRVVDYRFKSAPVDRILIQRGNFNTTGNYIELDLGFHTYFNSSTELRIDNLSFSSSALTSCDLSFYLFGQHIGSSYTQVDRSPIKVEYLKLYDGYYLARHLVPCVRIADSKPGMYDLCGSICPLTGTPFYINPGTGDDFTWGELQ